MMDFVNKCIEYAFLRNALHRNEHELCAAIQLNNT